MERWGHAVCINVAVKVPPREITPLSACPKPVRADSPPPPLGSHLQELSLSLRCKSGAGRL